jgi:hypothetical protein
MSAVAGFHLPNLTPYQDPSGIFRTLSLRPIDLSNAFFDKLGTNDRSCASCHDASDGWSITPTHLQQRFQISQGTDPVFRAIDGANCPSADVSTLAARSSAYSLLLSKGLIRMSLPVPANAEFSIISITDPYSCPETTTSRPALYRRPLPSTNLRFLNGIMWDGREPNLKSQARNATLVHAQPKHPPSEKDLRQIVDLESALFTAQSEDNLAGSLTAKGARGGPIFLALQPFYPGINSGKHFDPNAPQRHLAAVHRPWGNAVQQPPHEDYQRAWLQRRSRANGSHRHLHHLPQHAQRRQRFPVRHDEHRNRFTRG